MTYYAVIDTDVIISSMLKAGSVPDKVLQLALEGPIVPLINEGIISEYREVLTRSKFGFSGERIGKMLEEIIKRAIFLDRTSTDELFPDPDDAVSTKLL